MELLYRAKAARAARPARPMGPAVAMAAPPVEEELEALLDEEPLDEEPLEEEDEPVAVEVLVPVVVLPVVLAEEVKPLEEPVALPLEEALLVTGVTTGEDRPAGMEAAGCWEVTTEGWLVTAAGWVVTASGWPVTTPRELVSVRYLVAGLPSVELEESAAMAPMARAEREATMIEARILKVLGWVVE